MDQVKVFLRQCVKYRFWIAFGVSLLLPMIGYFVGSGALIGATVARENDIKKAKTDIQPYLAANPPNADYSKLVEVKKVALTSDVDATWRKLYGLQEPLLKWPEVVEEKFRTWGRKWPENVDRGQVQQAIIDYTIAYRDFLGRVYQTFKPWNPEDGTGIVFAPAMDALLQPAPFSSDAPPELGKVWAEQERLWVATALFDVVSKVNDSVGAKDWDGAIIKQILSVEIGTATAEDQKSLAKGVALAPAPVLTPDASGAVADPAAAPVSSSGPGGPGGPMPGLEQGGMGGMGAAGKGDTVFYLQPEGQPPYKVLPIKMTVLVDQAHLPDFLVGLENSPMAIQVMEPEISKPLTPVVKPIYGESSFGAGGMMGMGMPGMGMGMNMGGGPRGPGMTGFGENAGRQQRIQGGMMAGPGRGGMMAGEDGYGMGRGGPGASGVPKKGTDLRGGVNKAEERRNQAKKDAVKAKAAAKKVVDQYFNILEVTVYGQARFYNTPPAPTAPEASQAADQPKADSPAAVAPVEPAKADVPAAVEAPKAGPAPAKKDEAPGPDAETPAAPGAEKPKEEPAKSDLPAPAPKAEPTTPKA